MTICCKITLLALFLVCVIASCSFGVNGLVTPDVQWQKSYGALEGNNVLQTSEGGFLVSGEVKTDSLGNVQWTKTWGIGVNSAIATKDGGYALLLGGNTIYKINSNGEIQWSTQVPFEATCILQAKDGGYVIAGSSNIPYYGGLLEKVTGQIYKINSDGAVEWNKNFEDLPFSDAVLTNSGFSFTGKTMSGGLFLMSIDLGGNVIFSEGLGKEKENYVFNSFIETGNNSYLIVGKNVDLLAGGVSVEVGLAIKVNQVGIVEWTKTYERTDLGNYVSFNSASETSDGGYIILGTGTLGGDVCEIVKLDSGGYLVWEKTFDRTSNTVQGNIILTSDGGYAFTQKINGAISLTKLATTEPTPSSTLTPSQTQPESPGQWTFLGVVIALSIIIAAAAVISVFFVRKKKKSELSPIGDA